MAAFRRRADRGRATTCLFLRVWRVFLRGCRAGQTDRGGRTAAGAPAALAVRVGFRRGDAGAGAARGGVAGAGDRDVAGGAGPLEVDLEVCLGGGFGDDGAGLGIELDTELDGYFIGRPCEGGEAVEHGLRGIADAVECGVEGLVGLDDELG